MPKIFKLWGKADWEKMPPSKEAYEIAKNIKNEAAAQLSEERKEYLDKDRAVTSTRSKNESDYRDARHQMENIVYDSNVEAGKLNEQYDALKKEADEAALKAQVAAAKLRAFEREKLGKNSPAEKE